MRFFISDEIIKAYEKNNHVLSNTCEKDSWEDNSGADKEGTRRDRRAGPQGSLLPHPRKTALVHTEEI